jgi:probable HAF family extracellular repeat protein
VIYPGPYETGFEWTPAGFVKIDPLPGGIGSLALDINTRGQVVGTSSKPGTGCCSGLVPYPYLWSAEDGIVQLGEDSGVARFINERGEVAGELWLSSGTVAFVWTKRDGVEILGTLGGSYSQAYGLNERGEVVGISNTTSVGEQHGFFWSRAKGMIDLGDFMPRGISARGQVTGARRTASGGFIAAIWSPEHGLLDLEGEQCVGNVINERAEVAGYCWVGQSSHATVWTNRNE